MIRRSFVRSPSHALCTSRWRIERNELMEINRRQSECLRMLEEDYKKLDDDHQRIQSQYNEMQKKKVS